jgi:type IV secretory pathway VirB10-like protein
MLDIATLKKKPILVVMALVGLIISGGVIYVVNGYGQTTTPTKSINDVSLPSGQVSVTVNNFLNSLPSVKLAETQTESIIAPPLVSNATEPRTVNQLIEQPLERAIEPQVVTPHKPKMLVVAFGSGNASSDGNNAITGTNTSIGTGVIDSKLTAQKSPYTLFAGTFIPAVMIAGLNSELNGVITALVRNDIYDSTDGKYLLIPQGSKMVGTYNHDVSYGQNRLMVGWNRIIYPNGTSFLLRGQPGTDLAGYSGFTGEVDNHYTKIFGSAFLMGLIFGGMTVATGQQNTNPYQISAGATIATQIGVQMSQTGLQVVSKGLSIPPTIIVSPGYKFNVLTTADLILKPYIFR